VTDKFSDEQALDDECFRQFSHQSIHSDSENGDVVVASRIQLFRNIAEHSFVGVSSEEQLGVVRDTITSSISRSRELEDLPIVDSEQLREIERQFLLELQSVIDSTEAATDLAEDLTPDESETPDDVDAIEEDSSEDLLHRRSPPI